MAIHNVCNFQRRKTIINGNSVLDDMTLKSQIDRLFVSGEFEDDMLVQLLDQFDSGEYAQTRAYLIERAHEKRMQVYGNTVFLRGLIEISNYCKQNCLYCGIRADNKKADRYRLSKAQILEVCRTGYELGYRTFVLQGGEDPFHTDAFLVELVEKIHNSFPACAITLSLGERSRESYQRLFDAGADRYLLRHETASETLYNAFHPAMSLSERIHCLQTLKDIGYQVGAGFMTGLPGQTNVHLVEDLRLLKTLRPQMVGMGPFIPHHDTPLAEHQAGTVYKSVTLIAILRLILPDVLLPATTALGSLDPFGRELGIRAGANVVMPNLSPISVREKYSLYDGKICTGDEAAECRQCIQKRIENAGFAVDFSRGDHLDWRK